MPEGQAQPRSRLAAHFSSRSDEWATPPELFARLDAEFGFGLDVCALPHNAKCRRFFTPEVDGLRQRWEGVCWMNPPYGRQIATWVRMAYEASLYGATVVALLPARTDTRWWHDYVANADEVRFLRGRVKFVGARSGAPFPSAVVVFRKRRKRRRSSSASGSQFSLFPVE